MSILEILIRVEIGALTGTSLGILLVAYVARLAGNDRS